MRLAPVVIGCSVMLITCADPPEPADDDSQAGQPAAAPVVAEIICQPDGVIHLPHSSVQAQPDGVHIHVDSSLDEPVHVDGLWPNRQVQPGETDLVSVNPPGSVTLACWPVSQLESGSFAPDRAELEILDTEGIHVSDELECLPGDDTAGWETDWGSPPDRDPPVTPAEAGSVLQRLEPGDVVAYAGYPQRPGYQIAVERDDRTIAVMWFYRDGETVDSDSGDICETEAVLPSRMIEEGDDR